MADSSYANRQKAARARRVARARSNLTAQRPPQNPIVAHAAARNHIAMAVWGFAACVGHAGLVYGALRAPIERRPEQESIQMRVVAAPKDIPAAPPEAAESAPFVAHAILPKVQRRKHAPTPAPREEKQAASEVMPVLGVSVASTSLDGAGPAFAVGQSLAGTTDVVAPLLVEPPQSAPLPIPTRRASRNRVARAQPGQGVHVQLARRLSHYEPEYPALLQGQRLEGDVTVRVTLSAQGSVQQVELVAAATEAAFNDAALAAARRERFLPELHDGRPVPTSLTYTYRFRISP